MNSQLEKLFQTYNLSEKDKYEFRQIYDLLPAYKKVRAVENFVTIMLSVEWLREKLYVEHEILFWDTLEKIETKLNILKKDLQKIPVQNTTNT